MANIKQTERIIQTNFLGWYNFQIYSKIIMRFIFRPFVDESHHNNFVNWLIRLLDTGCAGKMESPQNGTGTQTWDPMKVQWKNDRGEGSHFIGCMWEITFRRNRRFCVTLLSCQCQVFFSSHWWWFLCTLSSSSIARGVRRCQRRSDCTRWSRVQRVVYRLTIGVDQY